MAVGSSMKALKLMVQTVTWLNVASIAAAMVTMRGTVYVQVEERIRIEKIRVSRSERERRKQSLKER